MRARTCVVRVGVVMRRGWGRGDQGFIYINWDKEMADPGSNDYALARNTNLNEDLGKVEYVFSDKTGTLTSNEMQLRQAAIKGVIFGDPDMRYSAPPCRTTAVLVGSGNDPYMRHCGPSPPAVQQVSLLAMRGVRYNSCKCHFWGETRHAVNFEERSGFTYAATWLSWVRVLVYVTWFGERRTCSAGL